ncbi:hypothetical protein CAOG_009433 [Capsaspora owczarzaki ATCC 30864]|uniref:Uncharacterized protein n=1 Tax=Capsaspora owczarzaki (strain ATCC 30864) TaxID=595528 RepID=A0A0D2WKM3_CAPO3|nr:hypothetical protein CAOG_009433 [Capsaspora owczarzaki ATCC 30864]
MNVDIQDSDINDYMRDVYKAIHTKADKIPTSRKLVGVLQATKICLFSPLLKWYLEHGLVITPVYSLRHLVLGLIALYCGPIIVGQDEPATECSSGTD